MQHIRPVQIAKLFRRQSLISIMCICILKISEAVNICRNIIHLLLQLRNHRFLFAHFHKSVCNCNFSDYSSSYNNSTNSRNSHKIMLLLHTCKRKVDLLLRHMSGTPKGNTCCQHPQRRHLRYIISPQALQKILCIMNSNIQIFFKALSHGFNRSTTTADINILQMAVRITELIEIQRSHQLHTDLGKSIPAHITVDTVLMVRQQPGMCQMNINMVVICKQLLHLSHTTFDHTGNLMSVSLEDQKTAGCASQIQDSVFLIHVPITVQLIMKKILAGRYLRCHESKLKTCLPCHKPKVIYCLQWRSSGQKLHLATILLLLFIFLRSFTLLLFRSFLRLFSPGHFSIEIPGIIKYIFLQFICNIITEFIRQIINQLLCCHLRHCHIAQKAHS